MNDSKVSFTSTMAWVTWGISGLFVVACSVVDWNAHGTTTAGMVLCTLAIIVAAAAATLHVRSFFCAFTVRILEAYEMGIDRGRAEERDNWKVPLQRV